MRVAPKVMFLFSDPHGFGPAIFEALHPPPNSNLSREASTFKLPLLEKYAVADQSCELAEFFAPDGALQVSVFLVPNLTAPVAICAIHELLTLTIFDKLVEPPLIIFPHYIEGKKIIWKETKQSLSSSEEGSMLYGVEVGSATKSTREVLDSVPKLPASFRVHFEPLNCLIHLVQVCKLPAVLLIGTGSQHQDTSAADHELEALCELGGFLANFGGLSFAGDKVTKKEVETQRVAPEPWRELYG